MADTVETPFTQSLPDDNETIVLLFDDDRNRSLLADWLESFPGYAVQTTLPAGAETDGNPASSFDLLFCDRAGLNANRAVIASFVDAIAPIYLPVVLATKSDSEDAGRKSLPSEMNELIDDVIPLPVRKAALRRRLENLLKARRASIRLAEREQQYQDLVELTPEAILLLDGQEILFANDSAKELFVSGDDLVGQSLTSFVPPEETGNITAVLDEVRTNGSLEEYAVLPFRAADGTNLTGSVSGVRITHGGSEATQLLVRDVTDERHRREQLHLFGRAIEAAAQGITIADARQEDEPLIYANQAFERITGYSTAETLGRNCRFLQGDNTDEAVVAKLRRAIDADEGVAVEILNYRKDGTPFWNELEIVPIADTDGVITHYLGLQKDVTERRERQEQLDVMDRVLRHNVRNRMNVIEGYAQRASPDVAEPIRDATSELLDISNRVREFRELTSDGARLESIDLAERLTGVVEGLRASYPAATLRASLPETAVVESHPLLCSSIGEVIEAAIQDTEEADIELAISRDGETVTIQISDHGGTLPADSLSTLERGSESPLEHTRGIGLWLLRWVVFHTKGDFSVGPDATPPWIRLELPTAEGG